MKGDKIIIQPHHERAARQAAAFMLPGLADVSKPAIVTVAGESGAGKSEIAEALAEVFAESDINSAILQQDDYFVYPPKTNEAKRREDIYWVGTSEVRLDLMDANVQQIKEGALSIEKPLVDFDADSIGQETLGIGPVDVVLVEGTYTTALENADRRIFIDRTYIDTRDARALRAREEQDEFLERVLSIEHDIISSHKPRADYIVTRDYNVIENESKA
jgi:uridine kinase